jgi:hypothetical protein
MAIVEVVYSLEGWWEEAEEPGVQVVETRKRVLGAEHLDTLTSMGNPACTYQNQGRWKDAEEPESDGDEESSWCGASRHTNRHEQPCLYLSVANSITAVQILKTKAGIVQVFDHFSPKYAVIVRF